MSEKPYRIQANPLSGEFSAEGDQEAVREDYRLFLEAIRALPPFRAPMAHHAPQAAPAAPGAAPAGPAPVSGTQSHS